VTTLPDAIIVTHRDTIRKSAPPWLQHGIAEKLLYAIAVQLDALGDGIVAGVKLRFPGVYSMESLGLIGAERRIRRGLYEADENYAQRLTRWWTDHATRGGPYALLNQLWYHYAPNSFPIHLVYRSGMRFLMAPDGTITRAVAGFPSTAQWAAWELLYYTDDVIDPVDVVIIPRDWIAAHILGSVKVIPSGAELWDYPPENTWNESGTWDTADIVINIPVSTG